MVNLLNRKFDQSVFTTAGDLLRSKADSTAGLSGETKQKEGKDEQQ